MRYKKKSSITERIMNDDYTIIESDFFCPPDNREVKSNMCQSQSYYDYCEKFNKLCELEELFEQ